MWNEGAGILKPDCDGDGDADEPGDGDADEPGDGDADELGDGTVFSNAVGDFCDTEPSLHTASTVISYGTAVFRFFRTTNVPVTESLIDLPSDGVATTL